MSQKESEWDENLKKSFLKELDFLSDHWVNGDDKPPFSFGGWREEVANEFVKIAKTAVSNREKEIAEEVNKLLPKDWAEKADKAKKEGDMYTGGFFMGMIDTVEKVLQILKH